MEMVKACSGSSMSVNSVQKAETFLHVDIYRLRLHPYRDLLPGVANSFTPVLYIRALEFWVA